MEKEKLEFVKGKTQELLQSQTCCAEGKAAAKAWLEAIGSEQEAAETDGEWRPVLRGPSVCGGGSDSQFAGDSVRDIKAAALFYF